MAWNLGRPVRISVGQDQAGAQLHRFAEVFFIHAAAATKGNCLGAARHARDGIVQQACHKAVLARDSADKQTVIES